MGDLDNELREAISDSEERAKEDAARDAEAPLILPTRASAASPRRNVGLLVALLVVGAGILGLVFTSAEDAAIYSVTTDQLLEEAEKYQGRNLRVEGDLVKGSLRHRAEPCEYRFSITKNGKTVPVRYGECIVPDTFRDVPDMDVIVTAEGSLTEEGHFQATHIMAKCPSKYEMQQRSQSGEAAPHAMMAPSAGLAPIEE